MNPASLFQYFVIAGVINVILFAFLLITRKRNNAASIILLCFMILVSFQALLNAFDNRAFFLSYPHLSRISWILPSLFGPLIFLFTRKIISHDNQFRQKDGIHFLFFAFYLGLLWPWFSLSAGAKRNLLNDFSILSREDFGWLTQFSIFLILFYLILTLAHLRLYQTKIENTFSELSTRRLNWIRTFILAMLVILFVSALGFYGRKWNIPYLTGFYHYNYTLLLLLIYWMAYKCLVQPELYDTAAEVVPEKEAEKPTQPAAGKYLRSGLSTEAADSLHQRLVSIMEKQKPYLEPDLTIFNLAELLNAPKHHVSQVINEKTGKSFFDYINSYRVEEVKYRLTDSSFANRNIMGIATDSGFNSKATFNTAFRKFTGMTPSAYLKMHSKDVQP